MKVITGSLAAATAGTFLLASVAVATPVDLVFTSQAGAGSGNVDYQGVDDANGTGGPFNISVTPSGGGSPTAQYIAWCIELVQGIGRNVEYNYTETTDNSETTNPNISNDTETLLSQLFTLAYETVAGALNTFEVRNNNTAFQMAIWEIIYEGQGSLNIAAGDFAVTNQATARGIAQGWLNNLTSVGADYSFTYYLSGSESGQTSNQDLLVGASISPVPLPAGIVLLLGGFGALAAVKRRQRRG